MESMTDLAEFQSLRDVSAQDTFLTSTEFTKKLRWMITNPVKNSALWRITPWMAKIMLEWNDRNRPISEAKVRKYAATMAAGRWRYTGQTISFSKTRILDGQHRLLACIKSSTPFDAMVVFGVPDESFAFIDVGKTRTASDVFSINGVVNNVVMAAAIQWVVGYDSGALSDAAGGKVADDHDELYRHYLKHQGLQDSSWVSSIFGKAKIASPSMMVALHYICSRRSRAEADKFYRCLGEGIGFTGKKDPAYRLHQKLVESAMSQQHKLGRKAAAAMTIQAWNATRRGRQTFALNYDPDKAFPRAI